MRKFERVLTSKASYKKQKEYIFTHDEYTKDGNEFTEKEFEELIAKAVHYTYEQPLMVKKDSGVFVFYKDELGINLAHYHSFEKFREPIPKEWKNKKKGRKNEEQKTNRKDDKSVDVQKTSIC